MAHNLRVPAHFGIRTERYKLIFFYGSTTAGTDRTPAAWEFYDLQTDPSEMRNLYSDPKYSDLIAELKRQLQQTRHDLNETDQDYPAIPKIINAHP